MSDCSTGRFEFARLSRRTVLKLGAVGATGITLPTVLQAEQSGRHRQGTAKSVIMLFQFGGASHLDTFDAKPAAPAGIRGEFSVIPSRTPGLHITEHLPRLAALSDHFAVIRTVYHQMSAHNSGAYYSLSGRQPLINIVTANASATDFPHPGSIVDYLAPSSGQVPTSVSLPWMIADGPFRTPGEFAGFLGKNHDPLWILADPNQPNFKVTELSLPDGITVQRVNDRKALHHDLAALSRFADRSTAMRGMTDYQAKAIDLLTSAATQKAFDLDSEPAKLRDRYGRHTYGQSCLLARRLVEAGVRFVTVYYSRGIRGWDTHDKNFTTLKEKLLPHTDVSVSALIEDLRDRGLLQDTLIYWTGDFGRTPKINDNAGRDHWPQCYSVLLAGCGVQGGRTYGESDAQGAFPKDNPVRPDDVHATMFYALGLDPETEIRDQLNRPMPIAAGQPLLSLLR